MPAAIYFLIFVYGVRILLIDRRRSIQTKVLIGTTHIILSTTVSCLMWVFYNILCGVYFSWDVDLLWTDWIYSLFTNDEGVATVLLISSTVEIAISLYAMVTFTILSIKVLTLAE